MDEAVWGMTTTARRPRSRAASAKAWAWFPLECVTTPRFWASASRENTALAAPRILNEPVRWRFSHLKKRALPASASREAQVKTGVR